VKTTRIYLYALLGLGITLGACKKDDAATGDKTASTTTTSTTTGTSTPSTTTTPAETASAGESFKSEEGKFSIVLPAGFATPTETVNPLPTPGGNVDLKMYSSGSGNTAAMFAFANTSGKVTMAGAEEKMLDGARDNVLKSMNGTMEKEEPMELDGKPGRQMIFAMEPAGAPKMYGRLRMFMVDPMMYQVMYISDDRSALESPATNAYFESFEIESAK
jgi:hypothetical protein